MRRGDFGAAWAISDAVQAAADRSRCDDPTLPYHRRWVWDGTPVAGREVLVRCYQGLGDTIQFARFLLPLAKRAAAVTLEVQRSLLPLLGGLPGVTRAVPFDPERPLPATDCTLEIGELCHALRLIPDGLATPYLHVTPAPLAEGTVGLCHLAGAWNASRSLPVERLAPLCQLAPTVTLVAERCPLPVANPEGCPLDMMATARLVAGCALVITVDTMIAHLAGALGRPTWLLLQAEPDWRWPVTGRDTVWYPTMRLYRQAVPGDWAPVLAAVERDLAGERREVAA